MPWTPVDTMKLRSEFISFAQHPNCSFSDLCKRFNISRKTGYKWLARAQESDACKLQDRSRKPHVSPAQTSSTMEQHALEVRFKNPTWGGRKIHRRLQMLGHHNPPAPSTISDILRRHNLITPAASQAAKAWQRFEHDLPNSLWQIDFKGYFETP